MTLILNPPKQNQYDNGNQDDAEGTDATGP